MDSSVTQLPMLSEDLLVQAVVTVLMLTYLMVFKVQVT